MDFLMICDAVFVTIKLSYQTVYALLLAVLLLILS